MHGKGNQRQPPVHAQHDDHDQNQHENVLEDGDTTPEVNISFSASTSLVSRVTRRPTGLRSKKLTCMRWMWRKIWLRMSNMTFCPVHCIR